MDTGTVPGWRPTVTAQEVEHAELLVLRSRARHLAATPGLSVEQRAHAHAGRIMLGLAPEGWA